MLVYNANKTKLLKEDEYNLEEGHLVESTITVHVEAVEGKELVAYYDQSNNGQYTVVQEYVEPVEEHDEERPIYIFKKYTESELRMLQAEKEKEELRQEYNTKCAWLKEHDYIGIKIATGRATASEYEDEIATMTEYAERINVIRPLIEN